VTLPGPGMVAPRWVVTDTLASMVRRYAPTDAATRVMLSEAKKNNSILTMDEAREAISQLPTVGEGERSTLSAMSILKLFVGSRAIFAIAANPHAGCVYGVWGDEQGRLPNQPCEWSPFYIAGAPEVDGQLFVCPVTPDFRETALATKDGGKMAIEGVPLCGMRLETLEARLPADLRHLN